MIKKIYNKILEHINSNWLFLLLTLFITIIILVFNQDKFPEFIINFYNILKQIFIVLLIVFLVIFLINLLVDNKKIVKYLGQNSGTTGWLISIITGIISSGPIYAWYPMLEDLQKRNVRTGLISAFLYNRAIKIPLMPLFTFYFGWRILILMTIFMIIFSIINGLLLELIIGKNYMPERK